MFLAESHQLEAILSLGLQPPSGSIRAGGSVSELTWLLAGSFGFLPHGPLHRAARDMAAGFSCKQVT